ncbi:MAG: hypothetical protein JO360_05515 [Acidobacteria bacterium]|nr:hypothetical protein [Acidobacteriota bacterium]
MSIAGSLLYQPPPANRQSEKTTAQPQPSSPSRTNVPSNPLEAVYIEGDELSYAGYDVLRSYDAAEAQSSARIRKNGRTLEMFCCGGQHKNSTRIGLFPFLGDASKQLVIEQYSGGAHCCWSYEILELTPKRRNLFDGERYGGYIGYELTPKDLDGDGRYEFTQAVMSFDYFHMAHSFSVFPRAVFAYDEKRGTYLPANRRFKDYLLTGIEEDLERLAVEREKVEPNNIALNEPYLSAVLQVMLKYIYAGQRQQGWTFFEEEYFLSNKPQIRRDIRQALKDDPIYQSIYK